MWLLGWARPASGQVFLPDDPLWEDPDRLDIPTPEAKDYSSSLDIATRLLGLTSPRGRPAANINTLGEVPNSSWYTNRHYAQRMSLEALARGLGRPPSLEASWWVVGGSNETGRVVLEVIDGRGDRFTLKFDPVGFPELATGAEVVAARLLHAMGYNVPDVHLVRFAPEQVFTEQDATPPEEARVLAPARLKRLLQGVQAYQDGTYRAIAVKHPEGEPLGPFPFKGTRPDDPNDLFPHEDRRELRGLRLFAAWLGFAEITSENTLDVLVKEGEEQFVRHVLADVSGALGTGTTGPAPRWEEHEYLVDVRAILMRSATLGFAGADWLDIYYPDLPAAGRFEADHFRPEAWKPRLPNPAFDGLDAADAFWAARQIQHVTDEEIRRVVEAAQYTSPRTVRYLADVLMARRDRIGQAYLALGGGLDRFRVRGDGLYFDDLLQRYRIDTLAAAVPQRTVQWYAFSNDVGTLGQLLATSTTPGSPVRLPETDVAFLAAVVQTPGYGLTRVYLRRTRQEMPETSGHAYEVVGLERLEAERGEEIDQKRPKKERQQRRTNTAWLP